VISLCLAFGERGSTVSESETETESAKYPSICVKGSAIVAK